MERKRREVRGEGEGGNGREGRGYRAGGERDGETDIIVSKL